MSGEDVAKRQKLFKHRSYQAQIKDVHLPSPLAQNAVDYEIPDNQSHLHAALEQWRQLNLALPFLKFVRKIEPLSASLPLLVHNWEVVVDSWIEAMNEADLESKQPLLDLLQKLLHDLRTTLVPKYESIWDTLLTQASRSLPPATFETYIQTISLFLKHLFLPSPNLCETTWQKLSATIRKCHPDVRRMLSEVWGTTFRRLKAERRREVTTLLLEALSTTQDAVAWAYITAFQSTAPTLHTSAPGILDSLWDAALEVEDFDSASRLLRRVLTATMHYCTIESFQPLAKLVVSRIQAVCKEEKEHDKCKRVLDTSLVVCAFRKGKHAESMLTGEQLSTVLSTLSSVSLSEALKQPITAIVIACLKGSEMSVWVRGRDALEHIWKDVLCGFWLAECLSKLERSKGTNWRTFLLPFVQKNWEAGFRSYRTEALRLLYVLVRDSRPVLQDGCFKATAESVCSSLLSDWRLEEKTVFHLQYILPLASYLPSLHSSLATIVEKILEAQVDPHQNYRDTAANTAWVLGSCLVTLGKAKGWEQQVHIRNWFDGCLQRYAWNSRVLEGLVALSPLCSDQLLFVDVLSTLRASVLSHINSLRLNALRLLASDAVKRDALQHTAIEACLGAEEVELSSTLAPERVLKTTKIGSLSLGDSAAAKQLCIIWLDAQMKVNVMPLWKAASQALVALVNQCGEEVWPIVGAELKGLFEQEGIDDPQPSWMDDSGGQGRIIHEDEKTWRNPGLHETLIALRDASSNDANRLLVEPQIISERFDKENYERQLLKMLEICPSFAERHNRDLVPLFLSFASSNASCRGHRRKLSAWLSLFSKFSNPKAVYATDSLQSLYVAFLSHPDRNLQTLAVDCVLSYKPKELITHEATIRALLDDSQWKERIMSLDLANSVQQEHRLEYVQFLIRMFYGMLRERRGRNKLHERRATIVGALRQCTEAELSTLVTLMLEPFRIVESVGVREQMDIICLPASLTSKQQLGFLVLLGEVMRILGTKLVSYWPSLIQTVISIVSNAQRALGDVSARSEEQDADDGKSEEATSEADDNVAPQKIARNVRQLGIKRFTDYFRLPVDFNFRPYLQAAFDSFISCRLPTLDLENTQSPSALMELFYTWSMHPNQITFLVDYNPILLPKVYGCLIAKNVKPSVVTRVFDIIDHILAASSTNTTLTEQMIQPHISLLLNYLTVMIKELSESGATTSEFSQRQIHILRSISEFVFDESQAAILLRLLIPLLKKPSRLVGENIKVDLLQTVTRLLSLLPPTEETTILKCSTYESVSALLQTLRNRRARQSAADVFNVLASTDAAISEVASLIKALNSFNTRRPDEPDFERRMSAFATLNENAYAKLTPLQWLPILNNVLFFIHDSEELSIRNNAAYTMRRFIEATQVTINPELHSLFSKVLFTGLKRGLRTKNELIRAELVAVIAYAIKHLSELSVLQDMKPLLANGDEEANFFNNIYHVQLHRRTRALRRLAEYCDRENVKPSTLFDIFIPILSNFIGDATVDHLLVNEAVMALGHIARQLPWNRYYSLVQQYMKLAKDKGALEKIHLRALVVILDNFHFSMEDVVPETTEDQATEEEAVIIHPDSKQKIADAVNARLLPSLLQFMETREETDDTLRLPMAVGVVKVALHLPQDRQRPQVTRLITILSQALRSRSSETRDTTRDVLCKVAVNIGPSYLVDLIRELRTALVRGPQLHVLAVTSHLLVHHITSDEIRRAAFGNLDDVAGSIAEVSAEVIFGQSNKELYSEEHRSQFREIRSASSKGLETMTILAKHITPGHIVDLLSPLRAIMYETESAKVMQIVDETLKRISSGLNSNASLDPKGLLSLCYTLISQNANFLQEKPRVYNKSGRNAFIVQTKRDLPQAVEHYRHNSYRFVAFGLDLLVIAFRRNRFDFQDPDTILRLEPMVNLIGNTLYSTAAPVVTLGLKAISAIVKVPLKSIPKALPVIIRQQVELVRQAGSAESETAQAALKSLASTLRDCPTAQLRESDLKFILETVEPDLEEVDRQAAVFALVKSIIKRKLVVPEIYDMLDRIASIVVTNQSPEVQETCRGILLQFLLDYPHGKGRLKKQMTFLASNLSYVFESGRLSVMTLLDAIIRKFDPVLLAEYADLFFVALVMVLVNDDSTKCREKASLILKMLYQSMDDDRRRQTLERVHVWASQASQPSLSCVAVQVYGLIADVRVRDISDRLSTVLGDLNHLVETAVTEQEEKFSDSEDAMDVDIDWQPAYHSLIILSKLLKVLPDQKLKENVANTIQWEDVVGLMLFPHSWVRVASSRLLGAFYASKSSPGVDVNAPNRHPLSKLGMIYIAKNLSFQLRSEHLDLPFSLQVVKNLIFIGKSFQDGLPGQFGNEAQDDDSESTDGKDSEEEDEEDKISLISRAPLPWLFSKLSYQVRSACLKRRSSFTAASNWVLEPTAILQWFAAMASHLEAEILEHYLVHILTPVYRILEDDTVRDTQMVDLKATAQELQDLVQNKVGTTKFTAVYGKIRQGAIAVRRERKAARAILAASDPQRAAQRQIQRNLAKRQSRKRKSQAFRENKALNYPSKKRRVE